MESRKVSWVWATVDQVLSVKRCELIYANLNVSAASTDSSLYDGQNTSGKLIVTLESAVVTNLPFAPPEPVYCPKGLFVDVGTNVTGIFVQWRELED